MASAPNDPTDALKGVLSTGRNVKLGAGVVGKTGHVMWGLIAMWAVIVMRMNDNWILDAALGVVGIFVTAVMCWFVFATHRFAEKNPAQAMLEGAEFLEYHKIEVAAKGIPPTNSGLVEELRPVTQSSKALK